MHYVNIDDTANLASSARVQQRPTMKKVQAPISWLSSTHSGELKQAAKIDFGFTRDGMTWAVELVRLEETDAVKAATRQRTVDFGNEVAIMRDGHYIYDLKNAGVDTLEVERDLVTVATIRGSE